MEITQAVLDALRVTLTDSFNGAYEGAPESWADKLMTPTTSKNSKNIYPWIAQQLLPREWKGPRIAKNLSEHVATVTNQKWEATVEMSREEIEDDNIIGYSSMIIPQLAEGFRKHPEKLLKTILQDTTTTTWDGKVLFADDHPTFDKTATTATYDNKWAGFALTAANAATGYARMAAFVGEDGEPLGILADTLIVPPSLKRMASEIVNAAIIVGANGTNVPTSNTLQGWFNVIVADHLENQPTVWYMAQLNRRIRPFVKQTRDAPQFVSRVNPDDPKVFDEDVFTFGARARYTVASTLPFLIAQGTA